MCGITAYRGPKNCGRILHDSLERLEYRGYDSAGVAVVSNPKTVIKKDVGEIDEIDNKLDFSSIDGTAGIGHTRWATHGGVSQRNAHPHSSCDERFVLVHNGILENWKELKEGLEEHRFTSETDSEVIAHYIEERTAEKNVEKAIQDFLQEAVGSFAVVMLDTEKEKIYALKRGSPLVLGIDEDELFIGSDIYAFSPYTDKTIFFEDDEYAIIDEHYAFKNKDGDPIEKEIRELDWSQKKESKESFEHYMRKEIEEIPKAMQRLGQSLETKQKEKLERLVEMMENYDRIIFTASGTSYHASLLGVYFLHRIGMKAQTLIASEFKNYERVDEDTLVVAISQSGETKDVLDAIDFSRDRGGKIASLVNVPHSTVERKSDVSLNIEAGQEICVAATKTFTNQLYGLLRIAQELGFKSDLENLPAEIERLVERNETKTKKLARKLKDRKDIYVLGRGEVYPVAREIALKLKEISYTHAEGMMGGELKHGTLALIEEGTPVISLIPEKDSEILSNVKEVEARGADSIAISPFKEDFDLPAESNGKFAFFSTVIGFLLTYWLARERGLPIDKPRNLAKSVTVK
ncbi:MAG: glutamine--fructose-6-phosphate transaminase (isomerizing) [Candidatus Aenigmatarchaeota archaeon]